MRNLFLAIIYRVLMRTFLRVIVGVKYVNIKVLKKQKQFILVSNHNSHLDTVSLLSVVSYSQLKKTHPIAAGDYFGKSPARSFITKLFINAILIPRSKTEGGPNPIEMMSDTLKKGNSIILFPEGSRGEPDKMQQFKKGIGIILKLHPDIPFIPVYMKGMGKILPKGEKLLVPFDSYVLFGEPCYSQFTEVEDIVKQVEQEIISLSTKYSNS